MKRAIFFTAVLCVFAQFTFGQETETKNSGTSDNCVFEKRNTGVEQIDEMYRSEKAFRKWETSFNQYTAKTTRAVKQRLDSFIEHTWDEPTGQWVASLKYENTYDINGVMEHIVCHDRDQTTGQWGLDWKGEYTFDDNENLTQHIHYNWDEGASRWDEDWKRENIYDANGNRTQYIINEWDESSSQWVATWNYEYTYDASGNMSHYIRYKWDKTTSQWTVNWKYEFTYDANGNRTQFIHYNWDEASSEWVSHGKYDETYDVNGYKTQYIYSLWNETTGQWVPSWKYEYTCDANGIRTHNIRHVWKQATSQWVAGSATEFTYDANGNPKSETYSSWDTTSERFIGHSKFEYTYDLSYSLSSLIMQPPSWFKPIFSESIVNKPLEYLTYRWDEEASDWITEFRGIYFYSEINTSSVEVPVTSTLHLYPNPVSDNLIIHTDNSYSYIVFELFDVQGRKVISKAVAHSAAINISTLRSGTYFYNLLADGKKLSGKIIKK